MLDTLADDHGNFVFDNMLFTDSLRVALTAKTAGGKDDALVKVDKMINAAINTNTAGVIQTKTNVTFPVDSVPVFYRQIADKKYKQFPNNNEVMLNEVEINSTRTATKPMASEFSANLNGPGNADQVLTRADIENQGGSLSLILRDKLRGVIVKNDMAFITISQTFARKPSLRVMGIMIDGAFFSGSLADIDTFNIESIEVLRSAVYTAIYGSKGGNGILIITTKRGGSGGNDSSLPAGPGSVTIQGFYKAREFYSPKYDGNKTNSELADLRSTIYWNPNIITDKDGNASFNYFNAGVKSTYRVIVQGIDINGKLGYQLLKYKVE